MFRRKKKDGPEASTSAEGAGAGATTAEGKAEAPSPPEPAPAPVVTEPRSGNGGYDPGYADDGYLPPRVWVESVLDTRPPPSREELARQAEADFQAAISPSLEKLREVVPDASSPEEARRALEEREREIEFPDDPEGERLRGRDIFKREASVHYRIQKQLERPRGRVGWGRPWEPPAGLAKPAHDSGRRSLPRAPG